MRVFKGKTAPWYIALFAAVMVGLLGLYIWRRQAICTS